MSESAPPPPVPESSPLAWYVQSRPIYQRYAKGIAAAAAALVNIVWLLSVLPRDNFSPTAAAAVAVAVQLLGGVVAVIAVPNSITMQQLRALPKPGAQHRHRAR